MHCLVRVMLLDITGVRDADRKKQLKINTTPSAMAGFFIAAGNTPSSYHFAVTLDTQMTLALLQELLLALRANDAEGFKGWMALGLEELGRQVVIELMQDWMSPLLTEGEQDRLVGWHLGVSF